MNTIVIYVNEKRYELTMMWSVIAGFDVFSVLISDPELLQIDGPVIQFLNTSKRPLIKAEFQHANTNENEIALRKTISKAIESQFLLYIRNEYSEHMYKKNSN
jgi:hypothetical protein